jgi:C-terminal processing protease CtpA/Prc
VRRSHFRIVAKSFGASVAKFDAPLEKIDLACRKWALLMPSPAGCPRSVKHTIARINYRDRHYRPDAPGMRIIALVDNGCGSDCEFLVETLATLPETVVVGENTFGVAQFIQPGYAMLPHTGLPFRIALGVSDAYGDGRSFDGYGFDVDIVLAEKRDWKMERLEALAERLSSDR